MTSHLGTGKCLTFFTVYSIQNRMEINMFAIFCEILCIIMRFSQKDKLHSLRQFLKKVIFLHKYKFTGKMNFRDTHKYVSAKKQS